MKKNKSSNKKTSIDFNNEIIIGVNNSKSTKEKSQIKNKKKNYKKRKSQKQNKIKKVLKWLTIIILMVGSIICFMMSSIFNIKEIIVKGTETRKNELISYSQISVGQNIYTFSKLIVRNNILENPYISDVNIKRNLPDKVTIEVTERVPAFLIGIGNAYIYIDNQGYALEISENKLELPVLISLSVDVMEFKPGDRLPKDDLIKLNQVINIINSLNSNEIKQKVLSINVKSSSQYILEMDDRKTVYLGDENNLTVKMLYLKKILESEVGIAGEIFLDESTKKPFFREKV